MRKIALTLTTVLLILAPLLATAEILPLSQVKKGMKGYGLTVFDGTNVQRFDVEILGVMHNVGPDQNLILARVDSDMIRRAGVIAGMSGSPIYIDGKVIGALAYSWQFAKEPIAGITPIEDMLAIGKGQFTGKPAGPATPVTTAMLMQSFSSGDFGPAFQKLLGPLRRSPAAAFSGALPISIPVSFSSFSSDTIDRFGGILEANGLMPVVSGSANGDGSTAAGDDSRRFQPGDPIAGVLIDGDFSVAATGTVSYVDGDKVYAFGHPFLDMGDVSFPMAKAEILGVLPNVARSFKFSNTGAIIGTLRQDRAAGILGELGAKDDMIPVTITVNGSSAPHTYHFKAVRDPQLFPVLLAMACDSVVANTQKGAGERTVILDSDIDVEGFAPIHLREGWAGDKARQSIPAYLAVVSSYLLSNEFGDATIRSVDLKLHHDDKVKTARLIEASVETPKSGEVHPGDTVAVRTVLRPYRGESFVETFEVKIPEGQKPGKAYLFVGSGSAANQLSFSLVPPDPRTLAQVIGVVERLRASTDLTVGLYSSSQGAVMAGVYLPELPPSVQAVVSSDSTNSATAPVKYHAPDTLVRPLDYIVEGALKIDLDITPRL
ncbi:MAG: SpoIVB peptidase S55 domain-containing protein [Thermoanaerobaculia bacterium]